MNPQQASYLINLLAIYSFFEFHPIIGIICFIIFQLNKFLFGIKSSFIAKEEEPDVFLGYFLIIELILLFNQSHLNLFLICVLYMFVENWFFTLETINFPLALFLIRFFIVLEFDEKYYLLFPPSILSRSFLTNYDGFYLTRLLLHKSTFDQKINIVLKHRNEILI